MLYVFLTFSAFVFLIAYKMDKKSPLSIFIIEWITITILYCFHLFGIYNVSSYSLDILSLGLLFFVIGYIVNTFYFQKTEKIKFFRCNKQSANCEKYIKEINTVFIKFLIIITFVLSIPVTIERLRFLMNNGFSIILLKNSLITGDIENGSYLRTVFVNPMSFLLMVISAYFIVNNRKEKLICFSGFYFALISFVCDGSKFAAMNYFMDILICLIYSKIGVVKQIGGFIRERKKLVRFSIIGVSLVFIYMFTYTKGKMFQQLYYYLCGCIPMLDKILNKEGVFSGMVHTYGTLSLFSIFRPLSSLFSLFGANFLRDFTQNATNYLLDFEKTNYAGVGIQYNAFTTFVSFFYVDFDIIGVVVMSFMFGYWVAKSYHRMKATPDFYNSIIVVFLIIYIILSMVRFQLGNYKMGLSLIYFTLFKQFFKKKKV